MVLTAQQIKELAEAAKPLMRFLSDNFHPHCIVLVDNCSATLAESVARVESAEFLKD